MTIQKSLWLSLWFFCYCFFWLSCAAVWWCQRLLFFVKYTHTHTHICSVEKAQRALQCECVHLCAREVRHRQYGMRRTRCLCVLCALHLLQFALLAALFPLRALLQQWAHTLMHTDTHAALLHCCVCSNCNEALLYRTNKSSHPLNRSKVAKYQICMNRKKKKRDELRWLAALE